jgi:hypothetical protein
MIEIGSVEDLRALAEYGTSPHSSLKTNIHIHLPPNFSAFDTVAQAMDLASQQKIGILGTSNYYDYTVYGPFAAEARKRGIFPIFGLETIVRVDDFADGCANINDPGVPGKMYLCGKAITRFMNPPRDAEKTLNILRDGDAERIASQIGIVADIFAKGGVDTRLDSATIVSMVAARHGCPAETVFLQERHIVQAFQEALFRLVTDSSERVRKLGTIMGSTLSVSPDDAVEVQGAIRSNLMKADKPAYVETSPIDFDQGYRMVLSLGGIPCYPVLADGAEPINEYEASVETLVADLKSRNIHCVEFIPHRNDPDLLEHYVSAMREAGFIVSAGTEHNTLDLIPMEPSCVGGKPIPEGLNDIFREGAYVIAAHQFLNVHGDCGYVDDTGSLNPGYNWHEDRIADFARLGAAAVKRYNEIAMN